MKKLFFIPICIFFAILIFGCCEHQKDKLSNAVITHVKTSDCLSAEQLKEYKDSIMVQYFGNSLYIVQYNQWVECISPTINTSIQTINDTIRILEKREPFHTDCLCNVNHSFQVDNVPLGMYVLEIFFEGNLIHQKTYYLR